MPRDGTKRRPSGLLGFLLLLSLAAPVRADSPVAEIRSLLAKAGPAAGSYGFVAADAETGEVILSVDGSVPRIPASTMKLVTSGAALLELGPDYAFLTEVRASAEPDGEGVLAGDLVVRGGGDPTLRAAYSAGEPEGKIEDLVRALAKRGLRRIEGNLVLDDGFFDRETRAAGWPENQLDRSYCAPVGALVAERSCVRVVAEPGASAGSPARIRLLPAGDVLDVKNEMTTTAAKGEQNVVFFVPPGQRTLYARGAVWSGSAGYPADIAVPDPTEWFGAVFHRVLARSGISLAGEVVRAADAAAKAPVLLARVETPLLAVLTEMNRESVNLYAACVLKTLGAECGEGGSFAAGAAVAAGLAERIGAPAEEISQVDGSGLSRENAVSPRFLVRLLVHLYGTPYRIRYLETLSIAGTVGTLERRMKDLGADVRAKTGTIRGVSALSGYVRTKSGRVLAFAFLENDRRMGASTSRGVQDSVLRILHEEY